MLQPFYSQTVLECRQNAQHFVNLITFSPIETPPDVTITSTFSSAECILASSESGLLINNDNHHIQNIFNTFTHSVFVLVAYFAMLITDYAESAKGVHSKIFINTGVRTVLF